MDSATASLDFAVIGHQDTWENIHRFVNKIRTTDQGELSKDKVKSIFPFIPPRDLFRVEVKSITGEIINGVYIDTFIDPDKLSTDYLRSNISKVHAAMLCAKKLGARIVALGGFTSIVLEGNLVEYTSSDTKFTTGNTLTSAYIINGLLKAADKYSVNVANSQILIIGATGDIGSTCVQYFKSKCKKLLLCARNKKRLQRLSQILINEGHQNEFSTELDVLLWKADLIICAASSSGLKFANCKEDVIICDAGYPKNLDKIIEKKYSQIFHGGMGQVSGGYIFTPDYSESFYKYPAPYVIHGCILEAMILAFEKKYEAYSHGKGNITLKSVEEIYSLGQKHGINIAPFYNSDGLCKEPLNFKTSNNE